ncbi:unnamed protein product [Calypogeia fissa]
MSVTFAKTLTWPSAPPAILDSAHVRARSAFLSSGRRPSAVVEHIGLAWPSPFVQRASHGSRSGSIVCSSLNGSSSSAKVDGAVNNGSLNELDQIAGSAEQALKFKSLVAAEINPSTEQFFLSDVDADPDRPTEGFSSIMEAVEALRQGKFVVVVDDEDRENEGDLIMAASLATPEAMAFLVNHCTGIVCVGMKGSDLDRLNLPQMVRSEENDEAMVTAFTVSVDARVGTTTGVSAGERAKTVVALASAECTSGDFKRPGHIFPLRAREGGVLKRAGHTEAAVDLTELAGLPPAGVLCELVNAADGSMSRLPDLKKFAKMHNLRLVSIADLVRFRQKRRKLVERTAVARLPTQWGAFKAYSYTSQLDGIEHIAMVKGDIGDGLDVLVRVHSECLTGDIFGSARCDCGNQLAQAMQNIEKEGRGVLVYLRGHEGRGIGLGHKLQAYNLQDAGRDTVEANVDLGLPVDSREYGIGAQILKDMGVKTMKLMTNNPSKYLGLKGYGLSVSRRVPILSELTAENTRYLETKRSKMGHIYGSDPTGVMMDSVSETVSDSQTKSTA